MNYEENEADIITELYARHFKMQEGDEDGDVNSERNQSKVSRSRKFNQSKQQNQLLVFDNDSIEESLDINTDIDGSRNDPPYKRIIVSTGEPRPETYSKPLQDKIKYV